MLYRVTVAFVEPIEPVIASLGADDAGDGKNNQRLIA
tara:strand:- start:282 stop:392 length:111 start_codon:yes stop_codon:yes gene_type:complete